MHYSGHRVTRSKCGLKFFIIDGQITKARLSFTRSPYIYEFSPVGLHVLQKSININYQRFDQRWITTDLHVISNQESVVKSTFLDENGNKYDFCSPFKWRLYHELEEAFMHNDDFISSMM